MTVTLYVCSRCTGEALTVWEWEKHACPGSCAESADRNTQSAVQQRLCGAGGTCYRHTAVPGGTHMGGLPEHSCIRKTIVHKRQTAAGRHIPEG